MPTLITDYVTTKTPEEWRETKRQNRLATLREKAIRQGRI